MRYRGGNRSVKLAVRVGINIFYEWKKLNNADQKVQNSTESQPVDSESKRGTKSKRTNSKSVSLLRHEVDIRLNRGVSFRWGAVNLLGKPSVQASAPRD